MLKWRLKDYLDQHDLSAYALTKTAEVAPNTVYALARGTHERVSLEVLDKVMAGLDELTGQRVSVCDLLERE
jgi:DNA-binding Xre family transcriptional regulator